MKINRPKIGLALGSGSMRGFAHIGVIKVLEESNIPIDYIAGTSIGAVIGALYSSGTPLDYVAKVAQRLPTNYVLDFSKSKTGLVSGKKIEEILKLILRCKTFEELEIPLKVVATELITGQKVIFDSGDILSALRASFSIPIVFTPAHVDGKILVDGAVVDRLPAGVVKEMGADIVIGVDVGFRPGDDYKPKNISDVILQVLGIMEMQLLKYEIEKCDVVIAPHVLHLDPYTLKNTEKFVTGGIEAAELTVDKIKGLIREKSNKKTPEKVSVSKIIEF